MAEAAAHPAVGAGRPSALRVTGLDRSTMETFKKRQKETRRVERQQEKAAKRKGLKELKLKAAGMANTDDSSEVPPEASVPPTETDFRP
jgi:hypothetical protein